jgi:hypothetical protein
MEITNKKRNNWTQRFVGEFIEPRSHAKERSSSKNLRTGLQEKDIEGDSISLPAGAVKDAVYCKTHDCSHEPL